MQVFTCANLFLKTLCGRPGFKGGPERPKKRERQYAARTISPLRLDFCQASIPVKINLTTHMWKSIKPGDPVHVGNMIRYHTNGQKEFPREEIYTITKVDQHYFEMVEQNADGNVKETSTARAIRFIDIGYNIHLEKYQYD
jgi:hypothetical protein